MKKYLSLLFILLPFITEKKLYSMEQKSCENNNSTPQNLTDSLPSFEDLLKSLPQSQQSENIQWNLTQEPVFNQPFNQPENQIVTEQENLSQSFPQPQQSENILWNLGQEPFFHQPFNQLENQIVTERNASVINIFVNPQINITSTNNTFEVLQPEKLEKKSTKEKKRKRTSINSTHNQKQAPSQYTQKLISSFAYSEPPFRALKTQLGAAAKNENVPLVKSQLKAYISILNKRICCSSKIIFKNGCRMFSDLLEAIYRSLTPEKSTVSLNLLKKIAQEIENNKTVYGLNNALLMLSLDEKANDNTFIPSTSQISRTCAGRDKQLKKLVQNAIQAKTPTEKTKYQNKLRSFIILASLKSVAATLKLEQKNNFISIAGNEGDIECLKALIIPILKRQRSIVKPEDRQKLKDRLQKTIQNELETITKDNKTGPALFFLTEVTKSLQNLSNLKAKAFDKLANNLENLQYAEPLNTNNSLINPPNILKK